LRQAGWTLSHLMLPDTTYSGPVCDDITVARLRSDVAALSQRPDIIIAVGSGTINDLAKWAAFELGLPYAVVATAASMNGYSAANVAPSIKGVKVLVRAAAPLAVFAEPRVIENAPSQMTAAGFGDAIAKCMSRADWLMNNHVFGEHFCPLCSRIIDDLEPFYLEHPHYIRERKPAAIEALFKGLFWSGVAMTMIGSSAPASGGEHLLSHTLDMMAARDNLPHDLHGRQVGIGTIFSAALYERLLAHDTFEPAPIQLDVDDEFWGSPPLRAAVREQWLAKRGELERMGKILQDTHNWSRLRGKLAGTLPTASQVKSWLAEARAASALGDIGCTSQRLRSALLHMHEIRKRCTIVDVAWLAGLMPHIVDDIMERWIVK